MHTHTRVHTHLHAHTHVHTHAYAHKLACTHNTHAHVHSHAHTILVHIYTRMHTHAYAHTLACAHNTCAHVHSHVHTYSCTHMLMHTHAHTCMHTHSHTHTCMHSHTCMQHTLACTHKHVSVAFCEGNQLQSQQLMFRACARALTSDFPSSHSAVAGNQQERRWLEKGQFSPEWPLRHISGCFLKWHNFKLFLSLWHLNSAIFEFVALDSDRGWELVSGNINPQASTHAPLTCWIPALMTLLSMGEVPSCHSHKLRFLPMLDGLHISAEKWYTL